MIKKGLKKDFKDGTELCFTIVETFKHRKYSIVRTCIDQWEVEVDHLELFLRFSEPAHPSGVSNSNPGTRMPLTDDVKWAVSVCCQQTEYVPHVSVS